MKNVKVEEDTWYGLMMLKYKKRLKSMDELIREMIRKYK